MFPFLYHTKRSIYNAIDLIKLLYFRRYRGSHSFATNFAGSCSVVSRRGKWKVTLFSRTVAYLALCQPGDVETSHQDFFVNFAKTLL